MMNATSVAHLSDLREISARQKSLAFFTLMVALMLEIVDLTIVNTALPAIQRDFGGAATQAQWVVAGYSLSFAVLLILGGRLGDLYGCRAMFILGVAGFTAASLACGVAGNADQLVAARVLQGAAGAIMGPQVLAMIQFLYDPVERIGRLAWFGVIGGLSAILGPIVGGLLIAADIFGLGWRTVFLINGPIGLLAIVAALRLLPRTERHERAGVDPVGTLLFGGSLAAFLYPLIRGDRLEWGPFSWLCLVASILLGVVGWRGLKRRAARGGAVIFDPLLIGNAPFRKGLAVALTFSAANTGFLFIFALSLQQRLGYSALQAGLIHIPFGGGVMFGIGFIGRRFLAREGKKLLIIGILLLCLFCGLALSWVGMGGPGLALIMPILAAAGIGMGIMSGPMGPVVLARVERHHAGAASGLLKTVQQMGAAVGVAILGSVYFALGRNAPSGIYTALAVNEALLLLCGFCVLRLPRKIFPKSPTPAPASQY